MEGFLPPNIIPQYNQTTEFILLADHTWVEAKIMKQWELMAWEEASLEEQVFMVVLLDQG